MVRRRLHGAQVGLARIGHVQSRRLYARRSPRRVSRPVDVRIGFRYGRRRDRETTLPGRRHGVAVVAEGIAERIWDDVFRAGDNLGRDSFGNVRLADVPLGTILRDAVRNRLAVVGVNSVLHAKDIGYELRCAKPVPFDVDYTRTLGFGAVRYLVGGGSGALIALEGGRVHPLGLEASRSATGRIRTRQVDRSTEAYRVARDYMVYLEPSDFTDEKKLAALSSQTNLSPHRFRSDFEYVALP